MKIEEHPSPKGLRKLANLARKSSDGYPIVDQLYAVAGIDWDYDYAGNCLPHVEACIACQIKVQAALDEEMDGRKLSEIPESDVWAAVAHSNFAAAVNFIDQTVGVELSEWSKKHPELWGNSYGLEMYSATRAWGFEIPPTLGRDLGPNGYHMGLVADHLEAVAARIESLT